MSVKNTAFKLHGAQLVTFGEAPPPDVPVDITPVEAYSVLLAENLAPDFKCWAAIGDLHLVVARQQLAAKLKSHLDFCETRGRVDFRTRYWVFFNGAGRVCALWCQAVFKEVSLA